MDKPSNKLPISELGVMTKAKNGTDLLLKSRGELGAESYFTYRSSVEEDGSYRIELTAHAVFSSRDNPGVVLQLINDDAIIEREKL